MSRYKSAIWKPISNRSTKQVQKDICCWHTAVGSLYGTWNYFEGGAGGRGVYSHGMIGGIWGSDATRDLDGVAWQMQDSDLRAAANLDGNWRVIAWETADNAVRPIAAWTPKQCDKIVEIMVETYHVDGIPLQLVPDSKVGRRGHAYHRLGCDPYRISGGELWSSAYGKDCPTDPRIRQLPVLLERARSIVNGTPEPAPAPEDDMFEETDRDKLDQLHRIITVNNTAGDVNSLVEMVTQIRAGVAAQADDESIIVGALAARPITLTDEQTQQLAERLGVDYEKIRAAVQFNVTIAPAA